MADRRRGMFVLEKNKKVEEEENHLDESSFPLRPARKNSSGQAAKMKVTNHIESTI